MVFCSTNLVNSSFFQSAVNDWIKFNMWEIKINKSISVVLLLPSNDKSGLTGRKSSSSSHCINESSNVTVWGQRDEKTMLAKLIEYEERFLISTLFSQFFKFVLFLKKLFSLIGAKKVVGLIEWVRIDNSNKQNWKGLIHLTYETNALTMIMCCEIC